MAQKDAPSRARSLKLKVGDWVEVLSKTEILPTLDEHGQLDGMPFMPEMFAFCGQRFQVYKRAHKTCDTVFPVRGRLVHRAVHLETRCDGAEHGGCQAGCLIFWKEDWLKRVDGPLAAGQRATQLQQIEIHSNGSAKNQSLLTQISDPGETEPRYVCQATQLPYATSRLDWWDIRQYIEDVRSGNVGIGRIVAGFAYSLYRNLVNAGIGLGKPLRWLYKTVHAPFDGALYPGESGRVPDGTPTPTGSLNLQPGELVRVKSHKDVLETLNSKSSNRGMYWDAEMVPHCGKTYRVLRRVSQIVDEKTGKMQFFKNSSVILDDAFCQSRYSHCRLFCPRSIYPYFREIWLERAAASAVEPEEVKTLSAR